MLPITKAACRVFFSGMPPEIARCFPEKITPMPSSLKGVKGMSYHDAAIALKHSQDTNDIGTKRAFMYLCGAARDDRQAARDMVSIPIFANVLTNYVKNVFAPRMKVTMLARNREMIASMTRADRRVNLTPKRPVMEP